MTGNFTTVELRTNSTKCNVQIEEGCCFENNSSIYRAGKNGVLNIFNKKEGKWETTDAIKMTNYQFNIFKAIANNNKENNGITLSKDDIKISMNQFREGNFRNDLKSSLPQGYKIETSNLYSNNNTVSTKITNEKNSNTNMLFGFGSMNNATKISDIANGKNQSENIPPKTTENSKQNNKITTKLKNLLKKYEGCKLNAYKCPAGIWTIGYGHTKGVKRGMKITQEQAEKYLKQDIQEAQRQVKKLVKVPLNQNQTDALVSFVFNLGAGKLANSTLLKLLNKGKYKESADQFLRWVYADKKKCQGLVNRREEERRLFLS